MRQEGRRKEQTSVKCYSDCDIKKKEVFYTCTKRCTLTLLNEMYFVNIITTNISAL